MENLESDLLEIVWVDFVVRSPLADLLASKGGQPLGKSRPVMPERTILLPFLCFSGNSRTNLVRVTDASLDRFATGTELRFILQDGRFPDLLEPEVTYTISRSPLEY